MGVATNDEGESPIATQFMFEFILYIYRMIPNMHLL